uniref:Uncharacterized protein n=1 Tax=Oryza sativa subsp. japonica TaxID=39947 RepID=Q6YVZ4_ORYSJ|nr:hypothetical protein [Oryza sativa Japonica Group]
MCNSRDDEVNQVICDSNGSPKCSPDSTKTVLLGGSGGTSKCSLGGFPWSVALILTHSFHRCIHYLFTFLPHFFEATHSFQLLNAYSGADDDHGIEGQLPIDGC